MEKLHFCQIHNTSNVYNFYGAFLAIQRNECIVRFSFFYLMYRSIEETRVAFRVQHDVVILTK